MKPGFIDAFERRREFALALATLLVFAIVLSLLQYGRLRDRQLQDLHTQASIVAPVASSCSPSGPSRSTRYSKPTFTRDSVVSRASTVRRSSR